LKTVEPYEHNERKGVWQPHPGFSP